MNANVLGAIRKAGQAMWTVGVMLVGLLRVSVPTVIDVLISRLFDGRTGGWTPAG